MRVIHGVFRDAHGQRSLSHPPNLAYDPCFSPARASPIYVREEILLQALAAWLLVGELVYGQGV